LGFSSQSTTVSLNNFEYSDKKALNLTESGLFEEESSFFVGKKGGRKVSRMDSEDLSSQLDDYIAELDF